MRRFRQFTTKTDITKRDRTSRNKVNLCFSQLYIKRKGNESIQPFKREILINVQEDQIISEIDKRKFQ